ncbi:K(+)-transporting ATPase subunit C [Nakamurella flava]|uniref:Potassium-transporting ATPase KdpC subunit n=1 Tax=Nakamurella flava TaxID=2576308 RepID=A0A4U6QAW1_9ACTN|nr:K(+)-transporting ATPase subunit C [Nakamurella flava]TKV57078.1 K(+)-transporting ATPase subunit C [Nakamurella flava]
MSTPHGRESASDTLSAARVLSDRADTRPTATALLSIGGRQLLVAVRALLVFTVLLGVGYPLVVFGIGQLIAPDRANGSLVTDAAGQTVGSSLIGQQFAGDQWFLGRPSAAGDGYDAMSSGGSNLSADSADLQATIEQRRAEIAAADGVDPAAVPADAVTASGSGLDPDISPAYALEQVDRVAAARNLPADQVRDLVESQTEGRALGFVGEERVNVLELNLALTRLGS